MNDPRLQPPVVIGGIGGSGTRLVAAMLRELGYYLGGDLNRVNDNLWFTLLFRRLPVPDSPDEYFGSLCRIFHTAMRRGADYTDADVALVHRLAGEDNFEHSKDWIRGRITSLLDAQGSISSSPRWGWKEPNTHVVIDRLAGHFPGLKYIHVTRNGLDMAHSRNQNQLRNWGARFLGNKVEITPYYSLKYWCAVHRRTSQIGKGLGENFLLVNFDELCLAPEREIEKLLGFLSHDEDKSSIEQLAALVDRPPSMGRYRNYDLSEFDPEDVRYVELAGFSPLT